MANEFVIRISADDKATATVNKIKAALGKITEPVEKAQKRVGSFGDLGQASLDKLNKGFKSVAHSARTVVDRIVSIIPGLTALGAAGSLAGIAALSDKFGNFGFGLNKSSKLLGMSAQDLSAWHVAAKRAGVSAEAFDSSMSSSQDVIRSAAFGSNPEAMVLLQKMGVQIQRNKDGSVDYLKTQNLAIEALRRQKSVEGQRAAADGLGLGALLPMIQQGTYEADKARAMRKGLVPTDAEVAAAVAFHQNVNDLEDSVTGLGNSIGSSLIPVLDPLIQKLASWLDQHRVDIADKITEAVQKFSVWIQSINWDDVTSKASEFWDAIGGIKGVAIAIAAITFAGPIGSALTLIATLARLTTIALPGAVGGMMALAGASLLAETARQKALDNSIHKLPGETDDQRDQRVAEAQAGGVVTPDVAGPGKDGTIGYQAWRALDQKRAEVSDKTAQAIQFFMSKGWSKPQATGLAANLWLESKFNESAVGDGGKSRGIAQWHEDRQAAFKKWSGIDLSAAPLSMQLGYVDHELRTTEGGAGSALSRAVSAADAARVVSQLYERPLNVEAEKANRALYAQGIFDYGIAPNTPALAGPTGPIAAAPEQAAADSGHDAQVSQLQQHVVTFDFKNVPQGARVDAKSSDGSNLPTKVNYAMGANMGAMP